MTTRELITFWLEDALLGVDVDAVQEVMGEVVLTPVPLASPAIAGLVNLRGQALLAVDLRTRMGRSERPADEPRATVILRSARKPVCLVVDRIGAVERVEDAQFEAPPDTLTGPARRLVRGAYKLDGQLLLELEIDAALDVDTHETSDAPSRQGVLT